MKSLGLNALKRLAQVPLVRKETMQFIFPYTELATPSDNEKKISDPICRYQRKKENPKPGSPFSLLCPFRYNLSLPEKRKNISDPIPRYQRKKENPKPRYPYAHLSEGVASTVCQSSEFNRAPTFRCAGSVATPGRTRLTLSVVFCSSDAAPAASRSAFAVSLCLQRIVPLCTSLYSLCLTYLTVIVVPHSTSP